jgi:hypothetical protein
MVPLTLEPINGFVTAFHDGSSIIETGLVNRLAKL